MANAGRSRCGSLTGTVPTRTTGLAVSQFWIAGDMYKRRADVVLFVNGIPLVFIELKVSHKNVRDAYDGKPP